MSKKITVKFIRFKERSRCDDPLKDNGTRNWIFKKYHSITGDQAHHYGLRVFGTQIILTRGIKR